MTQLALEWTAQTSLPIAGRTPLARHASASGAMAASRHYGQKVLLYLQLLAEAGSQGLSDYEATRLMGERQRPVAGVSSINSIRDACGGLVVASGDYERMTWPSGLLTKRARWRRATGREREAIAC